MDGSASGITSLGFGSWGSVSLIVTLGFGTGSFGPLVFQAVQVDASGIYASEIDSGLILASESSPTGLQASQSVVNSLTIG